MRTTRFKKVATAVAGVAGIGTGYLVTTGAQPASAAGCNTRAGLDINYENFESGGDCYDLGTVSYPRYDAEGGSCHNLNMRYWNGASWESGNGTRSVCVGQANVVLQWGTGEFVYKTVTNYSFDPFLGNYVNAAA
jgi:hypothetical protein